MTPGGRAASGRFRSDGREDDEGGGWSGWLARIAVGLLLLLVVVEGLERLLPDEGSADGADRPKLARWELLGCWELGLDPWRVTRTDTGSADGPPPPRVDVPAEPPGHVMLLPDSVDPWGRVLDSYRAEAVGDTAGGGPPLRWIVRGDTLWLLWSASGVRGGVALRRFDGRLTGRARSFGDSVDASARAEAWPVSCSSLERTEPRPFRR